MQFAVILEPEQLALYAEGVQFAPDAQVWSQWWILWRRIAGGLDEAKQELAERYPPKVVKLARAPGAREPRWAHLLCGELAEPVWVAPAPGEVGAASVSSGELAALKAEQQRMATELAELRNLVQRLARELGVE